MTPRRSIASSGMLLRRRRLASWALALGGLAACGDGAVGPEPAAGAALTRDTAASFQTEFLSYTLREGDIGYETQVGVVFTNRTGRAAYIVNCNGATGISLEKLVAGQWRTVWAPALSACQSEPITIPVGGTYRTRLVVFGGLPGSDTYPQFAVRDLPGVYRAVWHDVVHAYRNRFPFGDPLALESRVSNRFTLAVQPR